MFFYANERENGDAPINFTAFAGNPLQTPPSGGYNADVDIIYHNGNIYVTNRPVITTGNSQWVNVQKCVITDGAFTFEDPVTLYDNRQTPANFGFPSNYITTLVSPAVVEFNNKIRFYQLATNVYNDLKPTKGLIIMEGNDLETPNGFSFLKYGSIYGTGLEPWHISVFPYGGKLYAVVCCVDIDNSTAQVKRVFNYLAVSEDGENFRIFSRPLSNVLSYRSSACVTDTGLFVLYLATLNYFPIGSPALSDGRTVIMASKPFNDLLDEIDE